MDKNTRRVIGRLGGLRLRATRDPRDYTRDARAAFLKRFEGEVDPEGVLSPDERAARAVAARRAWMLRLALASSKARRRRAQHGE